MVGRWEDFFPFDSGEALALEARILLFSLKGRAQVERRTAEDLAFQVEIPEQSILGQKIPETRLSVTLCYREEGGGNAASIDLNGRQKEDEAVAMTSDTVNQRRRVAPSVAIGGKTIAFTLCRTGARQAEVREITGLNLPFELKIKLEPA